MTHSEYVEYQQSVKEFVEREGISFLSTGEDEPWFSWKPCECCGSSLGGNRETLRARDSENEIVEFTICEDCVYYVNYGRLDDMTMLEIANG